MPKMPFELLGREIVEGGIRLIFRCTDCGAEAPLFIGDDDPLQGEYPMACACGKRVNMFFGSPLAGKALLKSVRENPDSREGTPRLPSPSMN
jgi:hypothetical protein